MKIRKGLKSKVVVRVENSRRVVKSRPICVGLTNRKNIPANAASAMACVIRALTLYQHKSPQQASAITCAIRLKIADTRITEGIDSE